MRSTGGDESIPKFATFDDGVVEKPQIHNGRKELSDSNPLSSARDVKSELREQSLSDGWTSLKGLLGRSTSASNLLSRATLMESDLLNDRPVTHSSLKNSNRLTQDRITFPSFLPEKDFFQSNSNLEIDHQKTSRVGGKKSAKFVSSDDIDHEAIRLKQYYATKKSTFQNFSERMAVSVRTIDLSNRVAFARVAPPSGEDILAHAENLRRECGTKGETINMMLAKISPSPNYMDILNTWRRVPTIRQLCWSPSVSREADPFYGWSDEEDNVLESSNDGVIKNNKVHNRLERRKKLAFQRRKSQAKRDGRYGQIDLKAYIQETLPLESFPYLSFTKRRLPMRTDVGFEGATAQEIALKEDEVRQETELEEISPRIVVLFTSDLVATLKPQMNDDIVHPDVIPYLNYSIPGVPFAGKPLASAKDRNRRAWNYVQLGKEMNTAETKISSKTSVKPIAATHPDPFSLFSPPIDAIISSSQLWKPRPFFDRPAGLAQLLVVPVNIRFDAGDVEPLVCSMALYSLVECGGKQSTGIGSGKISEDFTFLAGDWKEIMKGNGANHTISQRTKKALFTFNPTDLPSSTDDKKYPSLYLVLQIFQLPRKDAASLYLHDDSSRKSSVKGLSNRIMDSLSMSRKPMYPVDAFEGDRRQADKSIADHLKTFGTQFLTPLCFGLIPAFSRSLSEFFMDNITWPNGESQIMQLFAFPSIPESQQEFVQRLVKLKSHLDQPTPKSVKVPSVEPAEVVSSSELIHIEQNDEGFEHHMDRAISTGSSASSGSVKISKKFSALPSFKKSKGHADVICGNDIIYAKAFLFTSLVGSDFSQIMLQHPLCFEHESNNSDPRLLVDISGDGAIMAQPVGEGDFLKRSNLLRLPVSGNAAGYANSSEIREILYIPLALSPDQSRHIPITLAYSRDMTNLLFIYPQSIKFSGSQRLESDKHRDLCRSGRHTYCLEVGLVQRKTHSSVPLPLQNLFNPIPGHDALLYSVYTKISFPSEREGSFDVRKGIPLRDEIKMRLPEIIDDTYFFHFTLHSVTLNFDYEEVLQVNKVADSFVPLCQTTGNLDKTVTTIISDGLHDVRIGNSHFTFEIRAASFIHLSNPSTAEVIKVCPKLSETRLFSDGIVSVCEQLRCASDNAVAVFFSSWVYYLLSGCISLASIDTRIHVKTKVVLQNRDAMMETIASVLHILNMVTGENHRSSEKYRKRSSLLKAFIDDFDDSTITHYLSKAGGDKTRYNNSLNLSHVGNHNGVKVNEMNMEDDLDDFVGYDREESYDWEARKSVKYTDDENILQRKKFNDIKSAGPFRRTAYGVNKIDRMKAEATLHESSLMMSQLMDDEETIFSSGTWQTNALRSQTHPMSKYNVRIDGKHNGQSDGLAVGDLIVKQSSVPSSYVDSGRKVTEHVSSIVHQVDNVVEIFVNPCGSPTLLPSSPTSKASRRSVIVEKSQKKYVDNSKDISNKVVKSSKEDSSGLHIASSDIEDELQFLKPSLVDDDALLPAAKAPLRGLGDWSIIAFSIFAPDNTTVHPYVYEVILFLWIETWLEIKSRKFVNSQRFEDFIKNSDFLLQLCIKSLILRCTDIGKPPKFIPSLLFDQNHTTLLGSLVEAMCFGLIDTIVKGSSQRDYDEALPRAFSLNDQFVDFLTGLFTVIHPAQVSWLITKYFDFLRVSETTSDETKETHSLIIRLRGSQLLRLRAVEKFSTLPRFIALNFPFKRSTVSSDLNNTIHPWTRQIIAGPDPLEHEINHDFAQPLRRNPQSCWLADLLIDECLSICTNCYGNTSLSKFYPSTQSHSQPYHTLDTNQSIALHSITIVYELILRSHAMDHRYQSEDASCRVASIFLTSLVDKTMSKAHILMEMDADDKIRVLWLSSVLYVLQEAGESALSHLIAHVASISFCHLLQLCTETFRCFTISENTRSIANRNATFKRIIPWLAQESYNTISAAVILLINHIGYSIMKPNEKVVNAKGIVDLLIYLLCIPQSPVTLLRVLGAVSHMIDKLGCATVIDAMGDTLQNWARVIFTLMNSVSLSVRSMAVDLIVTLLCSAFKKGCDVHQLILVFITVLPEVVAREIGLYSVSGLIDDMKSIERSIWPLRRALADVEASDPVDDDRLDAAFAPSLRHFCRSSQAIIDGVLIELRLKGNRISVAGKSVSITEETQNIPLPWIFDADEESLLEAANSFDPETGCMQRLRWLLSLRLLHERKAHWLESGETLVLCALDISQFIAHAKHCWLPSRFNLWHDPHLNLHELNMVCNDWHEKLVDFFEPFLLTVEGSNILRPNVKSMCNLLTLVIRETVKIFEREGNMEALALLRMEQLIKVVMNVIEDHARQSNIFHLPSSRLPNISDELSKAYTEAMEENAALRQVSSTLNEMVNKLSDKLFTGTKKEEEVSRGLSRFPNKSPIYVRLLLNGCIPDRFKESTTIPTFLSFDVPHICRVPKHVISQVMGLDKMKKAHTSSSSAEFQKLFEDAISQRFAQIYIRALLDHNPNLDIEERSEGPDENSPDNMSKTYISVKCLNALSSAPGLDALYDFDRYLSARSGETKRFYYEKHNIMKSTVELTVPRKFPFVLSRQSILLSMEFVTSTE